jgi:hypothetical protein
LNRQPVIDGACIAVKGGQNLPFLFSVDMTKEMKPPTNHRFSFTQQPTAPANSSSFGLPQTRQHHQNKKLNQQPVVWQSRFGQLSGASDWGASGIQQGTTSSRDQNAAFKYNRKLRTNLNIC